MKSFIKIIILCLVIVKEGVGVEPAPSFLLPGFLNSPAIQVNCNQVLVKERFSICYNWDLLIPTYVFYKVTSDDILAPRFTQEYKRTTKLIPKEYRYSGRKYYRTGWDAGHLPAAASIDVNKQAADDLYIISWCAPQAPKINRYLWKKIETEERRLALIHGKIYVITGVVPGDKLMNGLNIPKNYYKIIFLPDVKKIIAYKVHNEIDSINTKDIDISQYLTDPNQLISENNIVLINWDM